MENLFEMDLQLFATHVNVTTDTRSVGQTYPAYNDLSAEMKTFYDMTLIDEAGPMLIHDQFAQKRPIPANGGKTIEFRKFSPLPKALQPITEGVTPDGKRLDVTSVTATVQQYGDFIVQSDILELTALDNTILEATKLLGRQAGLTLDSVTRNAVHAGVSNVMSCPKVSNNTETKVLEFSALDKTAQLTVKVLQQVVATLRTQNAPTIKGKYVAIAHPYVLYSLMRDPEWVDAHKYASPTELFEGEVGEIAGVRFVQTSEALILNGEDLASDSRTLKVDNQSGYSGAITSIAFDSGTVAANALVGRYININGTRAKVTANTTSALTIESTNFGSVADNTTIYPGEGSSEGGAVYCTLVFGEGAYATTSIAGGGLEMIVKQKGSAGTSDPLDQRSSEGWKAVKTSELLVPSYICRVMSCVADFNDTLAN